MTVKSALLHLEINGWCVVENVIPEDRVAGDTGQR